MVKTVLKDGKEIGYDKVMFEKQLPEYWYRKYVLTYKKFRRHYGIKRGANPIHEVLLEKIALISTKMLYYESPDFFKETGVPIENPLYMGKYDDLLKQMVRLIDQIQRYTEAKPVATSKSANLKINVNTTAKELKELSDADIDTQIRQLVSGAEEPIEVSVDGETEEEAT